MTSLHNHCGNTGQISGECYLILDMKTISNFRTTQNQSYAVFCAVAVSWEQLNRVEFKAPHNRDMIKSTINKRSYCPAHRVGKLVVLYSI